MARILAQGSFTTPSERNAPRSIRSEVQTDLPVLDEQAMLTERGTRQTFLNETAINEDRFKNDLSVIAGFPEGRIIKVTYFSLDQPLADSRSDVVTPFSTIKDSVHLSFTQIRNFELRLPSEINFEYSDETNISSINGTALVMAGFEPHIHDVFLYELRNGKIGLFEVTSIRRMAIGQDTYHQITFELNSWVDGAIRDKLHKQSSSIVYFDKIKFLAGNHAYLTSESYIQKKDLSQLRKEIVQNYIDRFYKNEFDSFMRPDGIYDPYVVEYWNRKVSFSESNERPTQLFIAVHGYRRTIWSIMTGNPIRNLKAISQHFGISTLRHTFWSVNQTALINRQYVYIDGEEGIKPNPTISEKGESILLDVSPVYHADIDPELTKKAIAADFDRFKRNHGGEFPNQACAPAIHYTTDPHWQPEECKGCGVRECEWAQHRGDATDMMKDLTPPYPIVSDDELFKIWCKLKKYPKDKVFTEEELSQFQGYLEWYRETYHGTLSRVELEKQWRKEGNIPEDKVLTPEENASLIEYIKSYRKDYLPVLTNREIEVIWRLQTGVALDKELDEADAIRLGLIIKLYREVHGDVPDDGYDRPMVKIGSPITAEELKKAGAVTYSDVITLIPLSLEEIIKAENGTLEAPTDPIPSDKVPMIFKPQLRGYSFCPSRCVYKCGPSVKTVQAKQDTDTSSYVLSNEFYLGSTAMDPFERLVYDALTNKEVKIAAIIDAISDYANWDDESAFYREMLALYLIDYSVHWLMYHS